MPETAAHPTPAELHLGRLRADFDFVRVDEIVSAGLHQFIDGFQGRLNQAGMAIYQTFFAPDEAGPTAGQRARTGSTAVQRQA